MNAIQSTDHSTDFEPSGRVIPLSPSASIMTLDEANNRAIAAYQTGLQEGQDRIIKHILQSADVQKAQSEKNQAILASYLVSLVEAMGSEFQKGIVKRVVLGAGSDWTYEVLFVLERSFFFSPECRRLIADISDIFEWLVTNRLHLTLNAHYSVDTGESDDEALIAQGYTHSLVMDSESEG